MVIIVHHVEDLARYILQCCFPHNENEDVRKSTIVTCDTRHCNFLLSIIGKWSLLSWSVHEIKINDSMIEEGWFKKTLHVSQLVKHSDDMMEDVFVVLWFVWICGDLEYAKCRVLDDNDFTVIDVDFFVRSCRREGRCNKSGIVSNFHLKDRRKGVKCTTIVIIVCNLDVKNVNHRVDFWKEINFLHLESKFSAIPRVMYHQFPNEWRSTQWILSLEGRHVIFQYP